MGRRIIWVGGAVLYLLFFAWYTSFSGPLTDAEIDHYLAVLGEQPSSDTGQRAMVEAFMRSDTGDDFVMVNVLDMNESPPDLPATGPDAQPGDLINHYMEHMYSAQFARASHPVFFGRAVGEAMDVSGISGAEHWEQGALFRYRSRRDIMEIITDPRFNERHDYKMGALTKTIAFPVEPRLNPGDFRLLVLLALFSLASLIDLIIYRRVA